MGKIKVFIQKHWSLITLIVITMIGFKLILYFQSISPIFLCHDQSRDILTAEHIIKFNDHSITPPYCSGCEITSILKNSNIYYYFLAIFYKIGGLNSLLLMVSVWIAASIPITYLLTKQLSGSKYASILASLLVAFSPLLSTKIPQISPYQPYFTPTLSCLLIWIILCNEKHKKLFLSIFSGIVLIFGIQFHLSFLLLSPFYAYHTIKLLKDMKMVNKIIVLLFNLIILYIFIKFNTTISQPFYYQKTINLSNIFNNFILHLSTDLKWLFPIKFNLIVFLLLIFSLFFTKRNALIKLVPILILYLIVSFYSNNDWYTAIYWPIFISLISTSLMAFRDRYYFFIFYLLTIIMLSSKLIYISIISPLKNPSGLSLIYIKEISNEIDKQLSSTKENMVFTYDSYLNAFTGYYYYQELKNNQIMIPQNQKWDEYLNILDNDAIHKIVFCVSNCLSFEEEYKLNYNIIKLNDYYTYKIYQLTKKTKL